MKKEIKKLQNKIEELKKKKIKILNKAFERYCHKDYLDECEPAYCSFSSECKYLEMLRDLREI